MMQSVEPCASVVILAKDKRVAKTRLRLPLEASRQLALRLAASTVRAALEAETVGAVLVVTGDDAIALDAARVGAEVVAEPRLFGMNRAAELGRRRALEVQPAAPVAVMVADLPDLRASDLDVAIHRFHAERVPLFVADHEGVGTTFVIHGPEHRPGFGFGRGSAAMHERLGYRRAGGVPPSLRQDLDTREDLTAHTLGDLMATPHDQAGTDDRPRGQQGRGKHSAGHVDDGTVGGVGTSPVIGRHQTRSTVRIMACPAPEGSFANSTG